MTQDCNYNRTEKQRIARFKKIDEAFPLFPYLIKELNLKHTYLCGGSLFRLYNDIPLDCDLDIYFCSLKEFLQVRAWFNKNVTKTHETNHAISYEIDEIFGLKRIPDPKIYKYQLIKHIYKNGHDILSSFDLNISRTGYNGNILKGKGYAYDIIKIKRYKIVCPIKTLSRIIKFAKYKEVSNSVYRDLYSLIRSTKYNEVMAETLKQIESNERFY